MGLRLQILIKPIAPSHGDGALVHVDVHGPAVALAGPVPWPQLAVPLSWGLLLRALDVSHGVPCEAGQRADGFFLGREQGSHFVDSPPPALSKMRGGSASLSATGACELAAAFNPVVAARANSATR